MRHKNIAVLTTFFEASSGYSLITVADQQIRALIRHGYEPVVIVQENFEESGRWTPYDLDLRKVLPAIPLVAEVGPAFAEHRDRIYAGLRSVLADVDVVITHDIFFQDFYLPHNHACRRVAAENPELLWLNWIHSGPHHPPKNADTDPYSARYTVPPGYLVYPNSSHAPRVARMYRTDEHRVRVVRHMLDPLEVAGAGDLARSLYEGAQFADCDICIVYPCRLDRGKQPEKVLQFAAALERHQVPTSFLLLDWQSTGPQFQDYKYELLRLARELEFEHGFFISSQLDGRCKFGTPRETVLQLMRLADVFILPSTSETYSLVAHEAMLCGNLVVLNEDVSVMPELFNGFARYAPFSAHDRETKYLRRLPDGTSYEDEAGFWDDRALELLSEIRGNRVLHAKSVARTQWNADRVFKEQLEPLFHLEVPR